MHRPTSSYLIEFLKNKHTSITNRSKVGVLTVHVQSVSNYLSWRETLLLGGFGVPFPHCHVPHDFRPFGILLGIEGS